MFHLPAGGIGFPVFHTFWKHGPKSRTTPGSIMQNLTRCFEAAVELPQINILHRDTVIYCDAGSNSGTLPNDHEHGLHANRAIGDMRGRQAERHQQVGALLFLRNDRAISDGYGPGHL